MRIFTGEDTGMNLQAARETIMADRRDGVAVVHIRFEGRSLDIPQGELDIGPVSSDNDIKRALAGYLEVPEVKFRDYVIDRHETGNLTVRPEAVFG
jgi:hypothetical protein